MVQRRHCAGFALNALAQLRPCGGVLRQDLNGHRAVEPGMQFTTAGSEITGDLTTDQVACRIFSTIPRPDYGVNIVTFVTLTRGPDPTAGAAEDQRRGGLRKPY